MTDRAVPWIQAARPKTLPAAAVPVIVGGALAGAGGTFTLLPWSICLAFALLIQVGTNYANDYYDFVKGADDERRIGPRRAVASGWVSPGAMKTGMILVFALAFVVGCLLIPWGGWWLLLVGVASVACGVAYTGGPYPLGYNGWGDVFVFVFFGWVATAFTYYVQAGTFLFEASAGMGAGWVWLAGMVPGALSTNLLVVNNIRDEPLDREAGKRTLAVRFGRVTGVVEFIGLNALALAVPVYFATVGGLRWCLLVLLVAPLMGRVSRNLIEAREREAYQRVLGLTALLLLLTGLFFAVGLAISGRG